MTYMATPLHKNPCLGGHEFTNLEDTNVLPWSSLLYT